MSKNKNNPFESGADDYAKHRPTYPLELASDLASHCPNTSLAIEVGCGTGQFTNSLAKCFNQVIATDLSEAQIKSAPKQSNITYQSEPAEKISAQDKSASLIVAAQAAHWFELDKFYAEAKRVGLKDALVALLSYGVLTIEGDADARFQQFYWQEIHPFWAPDRKHVETGYQEFAFPFQEFELAKHNIICEWDLNLLLSYIKTWSAMKAAEKQGATHLYEEFYKDMLTIWGNPDEKKTITWPISARVGRVV